MDVERRNAHIVPVGKSENGQVNQIVELVLDSVDSTHTKRAYRRALEDFLSWHVAQGSPPLNKVTVQRYRSDLLEAGYSASSINQRLSAIKKLAREAADNNFLDPLQAQTIERVPGAKLRGQRTGNWLTVEQAQQLLDCPDPTTVKGVRDRAILALALGCGLRRSEIVSLTFEHIQQREGNWAIIDLVGKHQRQRSVPMPRWCKSAIDAWVIASGIESSGCVFRPLHKSGDVIGERLVPQTVHDLVSEYAHRLGLEGLAPHDLRRTFAQLARKGGAGLEQLQAALGHASINTTERYLGKMQDFREVPGDKSGLKLKF